MFHLVCWTLVANPLQGRRLALEGLPSPAHTLSESGRRDGALGYTARYHMKPSMFWFANFIQGLRLALEGFPSPAHTLSEGGHRDGEAADYIISEVTETIRHIRCC